MKTTSRLLAAALVGLFSAGSALAQGAPEDLACGVETVTLYFAPGESELSTPAREVIAAFAELRRGCAVEGLTARAAASDAETPEQREALRQARSRAVVAALGEQGLFAPTLLQDADGDGEATSMPVSRSVSVEIAFAPPRIG